MQKPQMKGKGAAGWGKYIIFSATEDRTDEMDEFGDFKAIENRKSHYAGTIDPRFDPDEVIAWLERDDEKIDLGADHDRIATFGTRPDLRAIAENAPDGTLAILVTVLNKNDGDNLLVMLADELLDRFSITDGIEVGGTTIYPTWGSQYYRLRNEHQGLKFALGDMKVIDAFRAVQFDQENLGEIRKEIRAVIAWRRPQQHTVEYIGDNNE